MAALTSCENQECQVQVQNVCHGIFVVPALISSVNKNCFSRTRHWHLNSLGKRSISEEKNSEQFLIDVITRRRWIFQQEKRETEQSTIS